MKFIWCLHLSTFTVKFRQISLSKRKLILYIVFKKPSPLCPYCTNPFTTHHINVHVDQNSQPTGAEVLTEQKEPSKYCFLTILSPSPIALSDCSVWQARIDSNLYLFNQTRVYYGCKCCDNSKSHGDIQSDIAEI